MRPTLTPQARPPPPPPPPPLTQIRREIPQMRPLSRSPTSQGSPTGLFDSVSGVFSPFFNK